MGQIFNFFPLSVLNSKIELSDEKKKKMIEEILYESHSVGMRSEVMERAHDIMGSEDFKDRRVDAYQQAYRELVDTKF